MKNIFVALILLTGFLTSFSQWAPNIISNYETMVINGTKPTNKEVYTNYEQRDGRIISWHDNVNSAYLYSKEEFNKLGYEFVESNAMGDCYGNCANGTLVYVRVYEGQLSITIYWYAKNARGSVQYLMFCPPAK